MERPKFLIARLHPRVLIWPYFSSSSIVSLSHLICRCGVRSTSIRCSAMVLAEVPSRRPPIFTSSKTPTPSLISRSLPIILRGHELLVLHIVLLLYMCISHVHVFFPCPSCYLMTFLSEIALLFITPFRSAACLFNILRRLGGQRS